jgi:hypothetical protein
LQSAFLKQLRSLCDLLFNRFRFSFSGPRIAHMLEEPVAGIEKETGLASGQM